MSTEPRNAASERAVYMASSFNDPSTRYTRSLYADDFVREDRRRLIALPTVGLDEFFRQQETNFEVGLGAPSLSVERVIAVAGENCCCVSIRFAYESGQVNEMLAVFQFDASATRVRRVITFDPDDLEGAVGELERLHAEIEAGKL